MAIRLNYIVAISALILVLLFAKWPTRERQTGLFSEDDMTWIENPMERLSIECHIHYDLHVRDMLWCRRKIVDNFAQEFDVLVDKRFPEYIIPSEQEMDKSNREFERLFCCTLLLVQDCSSVLKGKCSEDELQMIWQTEHQKLMRVIENAWSHRGPVRCYQFSAEDCLVD